MKIDYAKLTTEQPNPKSKKIDRLPIEKILTLINQEDQTVPRAVSKVKKPIARGVKLMIASLKKGGRIFFAGAGTSGRLGILEAAECPPTFNTPPSLVQAVMAGGRKAVFRSQEGAEDRRREALRICRTKLKRNDILIGIAASGVTPFVAGALEAAKGKGARTVLIAANRTPPLKHLVDCLIAPKVGPEVITGSTRLKAGTAAKLILNMITITTMIRLGKVYQNWMVDLQPKSKKLRTRALRLIQRLGAVPPRRAAHCLKTAKRNVKLAILMARKGWDYPTAAAALKTHSGFLQNILSR